jgi:thioredoxin reductase
MPWTTIEALEGDTHLERVRLHNTKPGASEIRGIQHVFMMTGADPNTEWLRGSVASRQRVSSRPVQRFKTTGLCIGLPIPLKRAFPESSRLATSGLRA